MAVGTEPGWDVRGAQWEIGWGGSWYLAWEPSKEVCKMKSIKVRFPF